VHLLVVAELSCYEFKFLHWNWVNLSATVCHVVCCHVTVNIVFTSRRIQCLMVTRPTDLLHRRMPTSLSTVCLQCVSVICICIVACKSVWCGFLLY